MSTLKVLGAGPVKRGVTLVAADFETHTGHKITVEFAGAPGVKDRVLGGEAVDIVVVPSATLNDFAVRQQNLWVNFGSGSAPSL